jgi:hypothetical protein
MVDFAEKINNYYNMTKTNINKKIDINKNYDFNFVEENDMNILELYLDKKLKFRAEYNIVGLYNIPLSVWYWSWNIAFVNRNAIKEMVDKVKNFKKIIGDNYDNFDMKEAEELYYFFSNDNFYISAENIDKLMRIALYLTKGIWILPLNHKNNIDKTMNRIEYILITKIIQIF